jgi:tetratricopeptide (TPR) repeat protein
MAESNELPDDLHEQIKSLCAEGDELAAAQSFEQAIARYNEAWGLVPDPKNRWAASTWIMAAIGDACFLGGYLTSALDALRYAMHCPDGLGNPFLHLRLGQVLFDRGELAEAADELARAYMGGGDEIFAAEDARYRAFLGTRMKLP